MATLRLDGFEQEYESCNVDSTPPPTVGVIEKSKPPVDSEEYVSFETPPPPTNGNVVLLTLLAAVSGFMFGYDTGIISGAMLLIIIDLGLEGKTIEQEIIVSSTLVGCIMGSIISKTLTERWGRRSGILVAAAIFTVGAGIMAGARWTFDVFGFLVLGRVVVGVGVGLASMVTPLYLTEVAPAHIRGRLVSMNIVFVTFGSFVAAVVAASLSKYNYPHGWELMLGLSGIPSGLQFVGMLFQIESPRWLAKRYGRDAAVKALRRVRGPDRKAVDDEVDEILASIEAEKIEQKTAFTTSDLFKSKQLRSMLFLGCGLQAMQQLAGVNTVMYYTGTIVVFAGWTDVSEAIWITAIISFIGFVGCCIGTTQVEKRGRRCLLLTSLGMVIVSLSTLGLAFYKLRTTSPPAYAVVSGECDFNSCYECVGEHGCGFCGGGCVAGNTSSAYNASVCGPNEFYGSACPVSGFNWGYVALVSVSVYLAFFNAGMGPIPWVVSAEIFPLRAKSAGTSVTTAVNWTFNLLVASTFLELCKGITIFGAFWLYGGISVVGFLWFAVALPETSGKKLEDIAQLFAADPTTESPLRKMFSLGGATTVHSPLFSPKVPLLSGSTTPPIFSFETDA